MAHDNRQDIDDLFSGDAQQFFEYNGIGRIIEHRNPHLGSLLTSERAVAYLNILYRMLLFKRDYELEPLYDDIYNGVQPAQITDGQEYNHDQFRSDVDRLTSWNLVNFRIEKQRLRGYRDNRKRKFRYRLTSETVFFLEWLEQRCLDDMQSRGNDTRDLLGETRGSLGELLRLLYTFRVGAEGQEDTARRVLFQLFKAGDLCQEISTGLADFNGRLLFFLVQHYQIDEVRRLIKEIEDYVDTFLKQTYRLRSEIIPLLDRLQQDHYLTKIRHCQEVMETERLRTPNLLQTRRDVQITTLPERLQAFFKEQGGLDRLLQRINTSSMQVWQKLRSHLRELERKNNRLQDIRYRIEEISTLAAESSLVCFFNELLAQPYCSFDPNYWNSEEKAEPPKPQKRISTKTGFPKLYLSPKKRTDKPVQSMDEARLSILKQWIENKVHVASGGAGQLSAGTFDCFEDFLRVLELAKAGLLVDGKRLARLNYALTAAEKQFSLQIAEQSLRCPEMSISSTPSKR